MKQYNSVTFDDKEIVVVIGLGRSGLATVQVLRERGATVYATDEKTLEQLEQAIAEIEERGASFVQGERLRAVYQQITAAVVSPGVPLNGTLVREIQDAGIPVFSEIEVAYRICKAPIVAVTGTKGKSTTTALIGAIFRQGAKTVHVGGNIGNALIRETADALREDWVIAEVSSFQLESIRSFRPRISLFLNLSPDHLDRYHSMDEYFEAKVRIFANQGPGDAFAGNLDDERIAQFAEGEAATRVPTKSYWYAKSPHRNTTVYLRDSKVMYAPPAGDPRPVEILTTADIRLIGVHNVENVMGAVLVGLLAGIESAAIREAVRNFSGMPHRLQLIAEVAGVRYVDDSKATTPGAVVAALEAFDAPIILIAGGRSKRTDFRALKAAAATRVKAAVLIGEAADEIAAALGSVPVKRAGSMQAAVEAARALACAGDVVLLSPACASFDMFSSAEARGDAFGVAVGAPAEVTRGA